MCIEPDIIDEAERLAEGLEAWLAETAQDSIGNPTDVYENFCGPIENLEKKLERRDRPVWAQNIREIYSPLRGEVFELMEVAVDEDDSISNRDLSIKLLIAGIRGYGRKLANTLRDIVRLAKAKQGDTNGKKIKKRGRSKKKLDEKQSIIGALFTHHKCDSEEFNFEPATQEQLAESLEWSQSKLSRTLDRAFGEHWWENHYKAACRQAIIKGFLKKLEDEQVEVDAAYSDRMHPTEREEAQSQNI